MLFVRLNFSKQRRVQDFYTREVSIFRGSRNIFIRGKKPTILNLISGILRGCICLLCPMARHASLVNSFNQLSKGRESILSQLFFFIKFIIIWLFKYVYWSNDMHWLKNAILKQTLTHKIYQNPPHIHFSFELTDTLVAYTAFEYNYMRFGA